MRAFFGRRYDAPVYDDALEVETPVGRPCVYCAESIAAGDDGWLIATVGSDGATLAPEHRECALRQIFGSVGHQRGTCSCFGGTEEDPPGMSLREAAIAAVKEKFGHE